MSILTIIKKNDDFQIVFEKGHSIYGRYIVVYFHPNQLSITRFGFCVGKKLGNAVKRNLIKRWFREASRSLGPGIVSGWDIIIVGKRSVLDSDLMRIIADLKHILSKASLLSIQSHV